MRTTLRITDRNNTALDLPIFATHHSRAGVYVIVQTASGLVGLNRDYEPLGLLVDTSGTLWEELQKHPAFFMKDFHRSFDYGKVKGDAIWLDFDAPNKPSG